MILDNLYVIRAILKIIYSGTKSFSEFDQICEKRKLLLLLIINHQLYNLSLN